VSHCLIGVIQASTYQGVSVAKFAHWFRAMTPFRIRLRLAVVPAITRDRTRREAMPGEAAGGYITVVSAVNVPPFHPLQQV
jgi:hypothetical protein